MRSKRESCRSESCSTASLPINNADDVLDETADIFAPRSCTSMLRLSYPFLGNSRFQFLHSKLAEREALLHDDATFFIANLQPHNRVGLVPVDLDRAPKFTSEISQPDAARINPTSPAVDVSCCGVRTGS